MYKKYKVARKIKESDLVYSLYLEPADGAAVLPFIPGQHLMFKFNIPGNDISLFRYFSFSDVFNEKYYRVSVKKEGGACSSYIFHHLNEGDIVEAKDPQGNFVLDINADNPVALFAGGIGITPLLCMLKTIAVKNPSRRIALFYGINDNTQHAFKKELQDIKIKFPSVDILTFYKNVSGKDIQGSDYDYHGLIDLNLLNADFRKEGSEFYICGPAVMMEFISSGLKSLGIAGSNIHTESFVSATPGEEIINAPEPDNTIRINYKHSKKTLEWDSRYKSILEFSEAHDIEISSGCLFGDCGTCLSALIKGEVKYIHPTMVKPSKGEFLPCSCVPATDITIGI